MNHAERLAAINRVDEYIKRTFTQAYATYPQIIKDWDMVLSMAHEGNHEADQCSGDCWSCKRHYLWPDMFDENGHPKLKDSLCDNYKQNLRGWEYINDGASNSDQH